MNQTELLFNKEQLDRLFPFYILINQNLEIEGYGSKVGEIGGACAGESFFNNFYLKYPKAVLTDIASFKAIGSKQVILGDRKAGKIILKGQFEVFEEKGWILFTGSSHTDLSGPDSESRYSSTEIITGLENANDELKKALATVTRRNEQLKKTAEGIHDVALLSMQNPNPLFRIGMDGKIMMKNPAAEELAEFQYNDISYTCKDFWEKISNEKGGEQDQFEFEAGSGTKIYSFACKHPSGRDYFNVYGRDITELKKNEEDLLRLSVVASTNESGVLFTYADGKIFWANEGFCKLTGYPINEIIGKSTLDFCRGPLTDDNILRLIGAEIGKSESFDKELIHYRKDGTWFWGRAKGQLYKTARSNESQYFAMVEDVTAEKEKEEQLKILSKIAEDNINAVIITDKLGYITWVNKSFTKVTGYTLDEVLNKKPGNLLQGPNTDKKTVAYLRRQIEAGEPFNAEILNYSKKGAPYWLRIQGQPVHNSGGELTGFFAVEENITIEKEMLERIKESEARFRMALEKIGDNVWERDLKSKTIVFSNTDETHGYTSYKRINEEAGWWDGVVFAEDQHLLKDNDAKYKNREIDSHSLEYRVVNNDGSIKWILDRGAVIEKDEGGYPVRIIGTHTDISSIKHTEIELEQRVKQFKSLSENIPGVIYEYEFRADGTEGLGYISPAVERVFGIKADDFRDYTKYIHPGDLERIVKKNNRSRDTLEPFYDESRLVIPGAGLKWHAVHSSFSYISQNGSKVFTGYMGDITERRNAEKTLRANEEKYRSIIANMNLGLLEVDNEEKITFANQSFCAMCGYSLKELTGKEAGKLFANNKHSNVLEEKQKKRQDGVADAYEIEVINKAGDLRWWLISGAPRYDDTGELVGSIGIHLDITDQKKQELELIEARVQAEQLARTKEIFLANMSHEIRTPMNAILGMGNQLAKSSLNAQQQFFLEIIQSAADNLLVIINDILDLSKIEAGKLSLETIGFEPKTAVTMAMRVLAHKAEEKGLKLTNSYFDNNIAPVLLGDPYRINQVLLNLMSNGIKFTEKGSLDLSLELLEEDADSQMIRFVVKDTGIGMDESFMEHLFDKFTQEYESVSRNYGGTGLGMSICRDLIELMGGTIGVKSKKGAGTTITFILKLKKGKKADLPEKIIVQLDDDILKDKKILIADDNEMNRLVASIFLQNYGAEIIHAVNGKQALEEFENQNPDVILMDIQMPLMNGFESTQMIRKISSTVPIIALTANAIKGENEKCLQAGMSDYVSKPFKEEELLKKIATLLGKEIKLAKAEEDTTDYETDALYDLSSLKAISRGNETFVEKMVNMFCDQTPGMIEEMKSAYYAREFEKMGAIAHKIKPSIDNLKIILLQQVIRDIENAGRQKIDDPEISEILNEMEKVVAKVIRLMKKEYPDK